MALTVNSNPASINAQNKLGMASGGLKTSMERLASGLRINSAKDDAAGLQISNRLKNINKNRHQLSENDDIFGSTTDYSHSIDEENLKRFIDNPTIK